MHDGVFNSKTPYLNPAEGWWWIVYKGDRPAAFAGLKESQQAKKRGFLCRAGVLAAHRGKGLQRLLIAVRERKAMALGWKELVSDTMNAPHSANNLIACGYRLFDPPMRWSFADACYWIKKLS